MANTYLLVLSTPTSELPSKDTTKEDENLYTFNQCHFTYLQQPLKKMEKSGWMKKMVNGSDPSRQTLPVDDIQSENRSKSNTVIKTNTLKMDKDSNEKQRFVGQDNSLISGGILDELDDTRAVSYSVGVCFHVSKK